MMERDTRIQAHRDAAPEFRDSRWAALMAQAQDGDRAAYRVLLAEIVPLLRAMAADTLRDRRDVEDAVQEALLSLHLARHSYDRTRAFLPWLRAIARHRIADRVRRQGRVWAREVALTPTHETSVAVPANMEMTAMPSGAPLAAAIAGLPAGQRTAVTLLKLEEMSLKEASVRSGMSIAALKVASHRAIKALRRVLA